MTNRIISLIPLLLLIVLQTVGKPEKEIKPNIIFILVDDMGWGDLGAFWQNQRMEKNDRSEPWQFSPNLDAMAKEGAMLSNHYCSAPVCAPSRASILTGLSQGHANVRDNQFDKALENSYTVANVLQKAGYATAQIGKWGLQGKTENEPEWPAHPLNRGFDYAFSYIRHSDGHEHYPKEGIYRGKKQVWDNKTNIAADLDKCLTTDLWTAAAKKYIVDAAKNADNRKPFFMYLAYDVPHAVLELPTQAYPRGGGLSGGLQWLGTPGKMINTASGTPDSFVHPDYANATYDDDKNPKTPEVAWPETYKRYATSCRRIDDGIGDIIQLLKDLKIDENTLVVFTSDNGPSIESYLPATYARNLPTFFNSFGPFDGIKRDTWEGGVRVPAIARWPKHIPGGKILSQASASYDWLPTLAQAAGLVAPARVDGVSLLPELTGKGKRQESLIYIEYNEGGKTPDFEEFSSNHKSRQRNQMQKIRQGDYVGVRYDIKSADDDFEIYNVVKDPQETQNLGNDASLSTLQKSFKAQVLRVRRPDPEAPRPYDTAPVPGLQNPGSMKGLKFKVLQGEFPWVSDVQEGKITEKGMLAAVDLSKIKTKSGMVIAEGLLHVPQDGAYQFSIKGQGDFLVRVHQATLLDGSFNHAPGTEVSGKMILQAGYHPVKIYYLIKNGERPELSLSWNKENENAGQISADSFSSN